jgi:D-beta-D-heptose 7-phosphate kinase/D-beta-D-heptose 1-phosphate adenosyltransferase
VIGFDEDTPAQLLENIRPDILVKGGDYNKDAVAGAKSAGELCPPSKT